MPRYNKLVRDRIPDIIRATGKACRTRELAPAERLAALQMKLHEEVGEYLAAASNQDAIDELADVLEVLLALVRVHGGEPADVEAVRVRKWKARGGFATWTLLLDVDD